MRLNSALVVNIIKSILGSVFGGPMFPLLRTGYIISVIQDTHYWLVPNVRRHVGKSYSRRTQEVVNECTTFLYAAGNYVVNHHGLLETEISGYVFFIWINIQSFYDSALSFCILYFTQGVDGQTPGHYSRKTTPDRAAGDRGSRL